MLELTSEIARHDPLIDRVTPFLDALRDSTGETVVLAKRQGQRLVYLATAESRQAVRVSLPVGTLRPFHTTGTGKALLGGLPPAQLRKFISQLDLAALTARTIVDPDALVEEILASAPRGYFCNSGGGVPDLSSVAATVIINDDVHAISVLAPSYRLDPIMHDVGSLVSEMARKMEQDLKAPTTFGRLQAAT